MEPRIQYARTADGVSIAFWTLGEGNPLILAPALPFSHIELEWQIPEFRRAYERLAQTGRLIKYDCRGSGLSDRKLPDYSLAALQLDLEAVVDRLGLEAFALCGVVHSGPVVISYAVRHPERVTHLVLWCSWARGSDVFGAPQMQAFGSLRRFDWGTYTETQSHSLMGWSAPESAQRFAEYIRECITPEVAETAFAAIAAFDADALLPRVTAPTLVLHRRQVAWPDVALARGLASRIADARLVVLEGASVVPFLGDMETAVRAVEGFLGRGIGVAPLTPSPQAAAFRTILFTDVVGSTSLTQRLGDARARDVLRRHESIVRQALRAHAGSEVKTMGDGFMASFSSSTEAMECAIAIQRAFADYNETAETPIMVRAGLNAGEPVAERDDLFGTAVQLAARICDRAQPGEILVSNVVREIAAGKGFLFADRGEVALRGFEDPVRLYEVRWREG